MTLLDRSHLEQAALKGDQLSDREPRQRSRRAVFNLCQRTVGATLLAAALLYAPSASAQFGPSFGGPGGSGFGGPSQPSQGSGPKKDPNAPETHAAPGAADDTIPKTTTSEPSLPNNPTEIPDSVKARIGSTADPLDIENDPLSGKRRFKIYPPYLEDRSGSYRLRTVFPFWLERVNGTDRASSYGLLYYQRRSEHHDADVLFPFFWRWREDNHKTTIVGPVGWHDGPNSYDRAIAPFAFWGQHQDRWYLTVPPLLTYLETNKQGGRSIVGPGYCFWTGGQTCNPETADSISYGVAPFFFAHKDERSRYELAVPLLHYYSYTELDQSWLNIWGPVITAHYPTRDAFHLAPLFFRVYGKNEDHITIPPLIFHYGYNGNSNLLVTPLFVNANGDKGEHTFATLLYARHRGRTKLDMVTPFYWRYEDPDIKYTQHLLFPFYWQATGPRQNDWMLFPFYGNFKHHGLYETNMYTPFIQHTTSITGWEFNIHPLLYLERDRQHSHTVISPFFWDFVTPKGRATVAFPLYWRFADERGTSQLVLNTYYSEKKLRSGLDWQFHFFPLFSYGQTPNGHWWNVLYGLTGYSRQGAEAKMKLFWIPITLSEDRP